MYVPYMHIPLQQNVHTESEIDAVKLALKLLKPVLVLS